MAFNGDVSRPLRSRIILEPNEEVKVKPWEPGAVLPCIHKNGEVWVPAAAFTEASAEIARLRQLQREVEKRPA